MWVKVLPRSPPDSRTRARHFLFYAEAPEMQRSAMSNASVSSLKPIPIIFNKA